MSTARADVLSVELVYCAGPGQVEIQPLSVPAGTTLAGALAASGLAARHGLNEESVRFGIWGKVKDGATPLRDGDRVELYRPLVVDPKEARRQRYQRHKERATKA